MRASSESRAALPGRVIRSGHLPGQPSKDDRFAVLTCPSDKPGPPSSKPPVSSRDGADLVLPKTHQRRASPRNPRWRASFRGRAQTGNFLSKILRRKLWCLRPDLQRKDRPSGSQAIVLAGVVAEVFVAVAKIDYAMAEAPTAERRGEKPRYRIRHLPLGSVAWDHALIQSA